jgi:hypothetical protein
MVSFYLLLLILLTHNDIINILDWLLIQVLIISDSYLISQFFCYMLLNILIIHAGKYSEF